MELVDRFTGELVNKPFQTDRYIRPKGDGEIPDDRTITEQSYIPGDQLIKDMQEAGVFLSQQRKLRFDLTFQTAVLGLEPGQDPDLDPTRSPGFDLVDAGQLAERLAESKRKRDLVNAEATRQAAAKAQQDLIDKAVHAELERRASATVEAAQAEKKALSDQRIYGTPENK